MKKHNQRNIFQLALAELGNRMTDTIDRLELLITDSPTEARIRAMNAFASLIKLDKENQVVKHSFNLLLTSCYFLYPESGAFVFDGVLVPPGALSNGEDGGHRQATLHRPQACRLSSASGHLPLQLN